MKQIVECHGGIITATSDGVGKGSTFKFFMNMDQEPKSHFKTDSSRRSLNSDANLSLNDSAQLLIASKLEEVSLICSYPMKQGDNIEVTDQPNIIIDLKSQSMEMEDQCTFRESNSERQLMDGDYMPKILLIDDEPLNLLVLSSMLKNKGFSSDQAASGRRALELI